MARDLNPVQLDQIDAGVQIALIGVVGIKEGVALGVEFEGADQNRQALAPGLGLRVGQLIGGFAALEDLTLVNQLAERLAQLGLLVGLDA